MAALLWGIHDFFVRIVTRQIHIYTAIVIVFFASSLLLLALIWSADVSLEIKSGGIMLGCLSGMTFAAATVALYNAFALGPVRVVASIIGAYPIFSVISDRFVEASGAIFLTFLVLKAELKTFGSL